MGTHPGWALARQVVLLATCLVTFQVCYQNKLATVDIIPIVTLMLSVLGVDITKLVIAKKS
jgi:hypothetical protein